MRNAERKVGVERWLNLCEEAVTKVFAKHEQIFSFADRPTDLKTIIFALESWLCDVTVGKNKGLKNVGEYIDRLSQTKNNSQSSIETAPITKSDS